MACPICAFVPTVDSITIPQSPSPNRLRTNYVPSQSEAYKIQSTLSQIDSDISQLDDALAQLEVIQERLLLKREALQTFSAEHIGLSSSIRCIPPEILAEIFLYFAPNDQSHDNPALTRSVILPSHVCRRWRSVALSTSQIWSYILFDIDHSSTINIERKLDRTATWLARAGGCPLSLKIVCLSQSIESQTRCRSLLNMVLPHCVRWRYASIRMPPSMTGDLSVIRNKLPLLESLAIPIRSPKSTHPFEIAPKLQTFCIIGKSKWTNIRVPWAQLTHCELGACTGLKCLDIMRLSPNLTSFTACIDSFDTITPSTSSFQLAHLSTLKITAEYDSAYLLDYLILPSLTNLAYLEDDINTPRKRQVGPKFVSLISRSSCLLRRLEIELEDEMDKDDLAELLHHTPNLEHLAMTCINDTGINSSDIQCLITYMAGDDCLVPRLQSIVVEHVAGYFSSQDFLDMIESRWRLDSGGKLGGPIKRITYVELRHVHSLSMFSPVLGRLRALVAEGLVIKVSGEA